MTPGVDCMDAQGVIVVMALVDGISRARLSEVDRCSGVG